MAISAAATTPAAPTPVQAKPTFGLQRARRGKKGAKGLKGSGNLLQQLAQSQGAGGAAARAPAASAAGTGTATISTPGSLVNVLA